MPVMFYSECKYTQTSRQCDRKYKANIHSTCVSLNLPSLCSVILFILIMYPLINIYTVCANNNNVIIVSGFFRYKCHEYS